MAEADGTVLTRGEALAKLVWDRALGWTEVKIDDTGKESFLYHEPTSWAMQLIWDRIEGKVPMAVTEDDDKPKVKDRVDEMATTRFNDLASRAHDEVEELKKKGPPKRKPVE